VASRPWRFESSFGHHTYQRGYAVLRPRCACVLVCSVLVLVSVGFSVSPRTNVYHRAISEKASEFPSYLVKNQRHYIPSLCGQVMTQTARSRRTGPCVVVCEQVSGLAWRSGVQIGILVPPGGGAPVALLFGKRDLCARAFPQPSTNTTPIAAMETQRFAHVYPFPLRWFGIDSKLRAAI
jgi:hypothetical protein